MLPRFIISCSNTLCTLHPQQAAYIRYCPDCLKYAINKPTARYYVAKRGNQYYRLYNQSAQWIIENFENYEQIYFATDDNSQPILLNEVSNATREIIALEGQTALSEINALQPVSFAELQTHLINIVFSANDFSVDLLAQQAQDLYKIAAEKNSKLAWEVADIHAKLAEDALKTIPMAELAAKHKDNLLIMQSIRVDTLRQLNNKRASILKLREFYQTFRAAKS
jgi:hypothetical protein